MSSGLLNDVRNVYRKRQKLPDGSRFPTVSFHHCQVSHVISFLIVGTEGCEVPSSYPYYFYNSASTLLSNAIFRPLPLRFEGSFYNLGPNTVAAISGSDFQLLKRHLQTRTLHVGNACMEGLDPLILAIWRG